LERVFSDAAHLANYRIEERDAVAKSPLVDMIQCEKDGVVERLGGMVVVLGSVDDGAR
jgi:hypothetical protein